MKFAQWETLENMKELVPLSKINGTKNVKESGLPIAYDDEYLYVNSKGGHSLVIGSSGSGKTQAISLPMLDLACLASESIVVGDAGNELYNVTKDMFKKNGYNIIKLNFDEATGTNNWNPFDVAKKLYNEKDFDAAVETIDNIGYYLLNNPVDVNADPFWINTATSYFTGMCVYLLENKKELNLDTIYDLNETIKSNPDKFVKSLDKHSTSYINLSSILTTVETTRMNIISVFESKFKNYVGKENLRKMLSKSDFDISKISEEKTVVFVKYGKAKLSGSLISLFVHQIYQTKNDKKRLNVILDEFYNACPILDFPKVLNYSRGEGISFTIMIRGFNDLKNTYGREGAEMVRLGFSNIVYLLSQDNETLEEMSKLCGDASKNQPLISVEELKCIRPFEAVILIPRMMPFKTKLLPYYEISQK